MISMIVTQVEKITRAKVRVVLNEETVWILPPSVADAWQLRPGRELSREEYDEIYDTVVLRGAKKKALDLLGRRDHTRHELKEKLLRQGFDEVRVCSSGAKALSEISHLESGVVISGCRLADMNYTELLECLPNYFEMLLIGSRAVLSDRCEGVLALATPLRVSELADTLGMMLRQLERRKKKDRKKPKKRSEKEENYIRNAKFLLMERNCLTEEEAHRYLQKCSMDSGTNLVETAQMVLMLLYDSV